MEHAPYRAYWARSCAFHEEAAMDRIDLTFNSIFDDEYTNAVDGQSLSPRRAEVCSRSRGPLLP
ncbi:hypothetical protein ACO0M4_10070 [Streptomyces sp. RGM 3693]|uniref:hypothetical protein n=1 Tax=Streptomyces sp. RGM 3693 TaxID=3413284 RepID=UPI003D2C0AE7